MTIALLRLDGSGLEQHLEPLTSLLVESVAQGASISFISPFSQQDAWQFWLENVKPDVESGGRALFAALLDGNLLGTVQLITRMPPNQPHRCEVAKMIVHPGARRCGLGRAMMHHIMQYAREQGKTLMTLDTRTGAAGEALYRSVGFKVAGMTPGFALDTDGKSTHSTTWMYCTL
ncbi:acetyltransferase [Mangrovibacter sp. MFB070]|uniref:GNAT family N-acetyltransferase n=1 Tax=Mangrovibacter sp. MFB070 TaxID=1224318 RepID=UPI0004D670DF|nr:GNAT family N-acetyltransferase [Mangrovibacter sp. MFB070]KEA52485.1 acetyltransferase [Mangrovibacter sp. MFB070]